MKTYTLKKVQGLPNWDLIPIMSLDEQMWEKSNTVTAQAQLCWNEDAIHVHLKANEQDLRMEESGLLADVSADSCLEFFFRPTERIDFFNFEFNPNCVMFLGFANGKNHTAELVRLLVNDAEKVFFPQSKITADGWELTFRIPHNFVARFFPDYIPEEGREMYGNAYKCGNKLRNMHYLAWNPVNPEIHSFHRPQDFGRLILGGE